MSEQGPADAALHELLNAYLDGELPDEDTEAVAAYLDRSPAARADIEALAAVRVSVRSLGPVEPPPGFLESLLRAGADDAPASVAPAPATVDEPAAPSPFRRPAGGGSGPSRTRGARTRGRSRSGPSFGRVAGAVAAAAAAILVILGVTPLTDAVVPPVQAFAARHDQMMAAPPLPGAGGTTSTVPPTTPQTTVEATPSTTAPPGSAAADAMGFAPMAAPELDTMDEPFVAPAAVSNGSMTRMAAYHSGTGVLHVMYSDGNAVISVYEQAGEVRWDELPQGTTMTVGGDPAWAMRSGGDDVMVVARGPLVYTIVATAPHDVTMALAQDLPHPGDPSMTDRAQAACRSVVSRFGLSD